MAEFSMGWSDGRIAAACSLKPSAPAALSSGFDLQGAMPSALKGRAASI